MQQNNTSEPENAETLLLADILQNLGMSSQSGLVEFTSGTSAGHIYLQYGKTVHASTPLQEGEEAIFEMLLWPEGTWRVHEEFPAPKRSIQRETEDLLLEAARRFTGSIPIQTNTGRLQTSVGMVGSQPFLIIQEPGLPERQLDLIKDLLHIGRQASNDLPLNDPGLSSRHCVLLISGRDTTLRDLNSTNGTFVNGEPIDEVVLKIGDIIQIGGIQIRYESKLKRPKLSELKKGHYKADQLPSKKTAKRPSLTPTGAIRMHASTNVHAKGKSASTTTSSQRASLWMGLIVAGVFIIALLAFFMFHR